MPIWLYTIARAAVYAWGIGRGLGTETGVLTTNYRLLNLLQTLYQAEVACARYRLQPALDVEFAK